MRPLHAAEIGDNNETQIETEYSQRDVEISETEEMAPLVLSQASDEDTQLEQEQDEEDSWRVYLDLYAFLVPTTYSTTTINGNTNSAEQSLSDVIIPSMKCSPLKPRLNTADSGSWPVSITGASPEADPNPSLRKQRTPCAISSDFHLHSDSARFASMEI